MKRLMVVVATAMVLIGIPGTAAAQDIHSDVGATVVNCNHYSGGGILPRSAAYVKRWDGLVNLGAIQLCKSSSEYYWAYVVFYSPVPTGNWGNAYLDHYIDGQYTGSYTCNASGGNGWVRPGQTQCWTPKVPGVGSRHTFRARGYQWEGPYPAQNFRQGYGVTATVH